MRSNTIPRSGLALLVALSVLAPSLAGSQSRWENHVDPSLIKEIVSRDDKLYVATFGGLLVYDIAADRFTQYTNTSGLTTISLTTLVFDPSGRLYVGSDDFGIARVTISGGKLELQRSFNQRFDGLADNRILSLAVWGDSVVYGAATGMGTIHNDFASTALRIQDGLPAESVKDIFPHGEVVWVATDGGVVVLDRQGFLLPVPGAPAEANVFGSDGPTVFVGTDAGVMRFDPADSSWTDLGLSTRKVDSFFYDGQSMWGAGRFLLWNYSGSGQTWDETRMDSFVGQYGLTGGIVEADIVVASNGDVYMGIGQQDDGARGANLIRFDGIISTNLVPDAPSGNAIRRLSFDAANGDLWASFANFYAGKLTESGTWFNYNESIPASDSMSNRFANIAFLAASDGSKWFATTPGSGTIPLDRLMDNRDTDYSNDIWDHIRAGDGGRDGLGSQSLQRAVEDVQGHVWFLSDAQRVSMGWHGINIYNPSNDEWLTISPDTRSGMADGDVVDVAFGQTFTYVAMRDWGVQPWRHGGFNWTELVSLDDPDREWQSSPLRVGVTDELPDVKLAALALRSDGVLWIATEGDGLYKWDGGITPPKHIPGFTGIGTGVLSPKVAAIALDHDENLWVATSSGLNRIARDDDNDITAFSTPAEYQRSLITLGYPFDVITPLVHENCQSLAVHPTLDVLYIGTFAGLSVLDISPAPAVETDLSSVYLYPNPLYGRKGHNDLKIENITGPVTVEVYTIEGEMVHEQTVSQSGEVVWDLTTKAGFIAASGVYLVRIRTDSGVVVKTVAIIR